MASEVIVSAAALTDGGSKATEAFSAAALPDDGLAKVLGVLPPRSLAVARCVCKAWRDVIDARAHPVRGVLINYIDHHRPHLFARPASTSSSTTFPKVDGLLSFVPNGAERDLWWVLDHCNGLLLCSIHGGTRLLVCNPASQRWTPLPSGHPCVVSCCAYISFDPIVSPRYEVFLIPHLPEKVQQPAPDDWEALLALDAPFGLERAALSIEGDNNQTDEGQDAWSIDEDGQTDKCQDDLSIDGEEEDQKDKGQDQDDDPCRLMEWPPSPWSLKVFSSSTGLWKDRIFVREGKPVGTVEDLRLDPQESTWRGPRQRYAVYQNGVLYVHCRGSFMARFSLSTNKYQVVRMPIPTKTYRLKHYLGASKNVVYFGVVDEERQLRLWTLSESCGHMEWLLKYEADIGPHADHIASLPYNNGRKRDGSWMVEEASYHVNDSDGNIEAQSGESIEWDSDKDDIFTVEDGDEYYRKGWFDILGFHPYKEVVFLAVSSFCVASYHFTSPDKMQYLGNSRPRCYYRNYTNDIFESFVYTPCMIGDLIHGDDTGDTSLEDQH